MKLHRLLAPKLYRRLETLKRENDLLKIGQQEPGALQALSRLFAQFYPPLEIEPVEAATAAQRNEADCRDFEALFNHYGSDKSSTHNNHFIYEYVLRGKRQQPLHLLEIGLGTNFSDVPSNMGVAGKPGASLRAFRDWAPRATVTGADVDRRVLFTEERITTCFVDQLDPATLRELANRFTPRSLDLAIDDGLHTPEANVNFLGVALDLIKDDGFVVVEDIAERHHVFWSFVACALHGRYRLRFLKTRHGCVVIVNRV